MINIILYIFPRSQVKRLLIIIRRRIGKVFQKNVNVCTYNSTYSSIRLKIAYNIYTYDIFTYIHTYIQGNVRV